MHNTVPHTKYVFCFITITLSVREIYVIMMYPNSSYLYRFHWDILRISSWQIYAYPNTNPADNFQMHYDNNAPSLNQNENNAYSIF